MRSTGSSNYRLSRMLILLTAMAVLLPLLAALQYYWLGQVSQGASERLQSSLNSSATAFRHDFNREFIRAYLNFHVDSLTLPADLAKYHTERLEQWNQSAPYPQLISGVFVVTYDKQGVPQPSRLNAQTKSFESAEWARDIPLLRERFERHALESFAEEIPALIVPFPPAPTEDEQSQAQALTTQKAKGPPPPLGFTIIKLDLSYMQREFIPSLLKRHLFDESHGEYNAAIVSLKDPPTVIYSSGFPAADFNSADVSTLIFGLEADELETFLRSKGTAAGTAEQPAGQPSRLIKLRLLRRPPVRGSQTNGPSGPGSSATASAADDGRWRLLIKHQSGSLAAAVSSARHRNLAISFGILLLLGGGILMTAISTRRAERLVQQQINFVAGVSHELRTPLAVICSAGENLADGIVDNPQKAAQYGQLIYREGRRLTDMVEQVLEFAGAQSGRQRYEFRPTEVPQFIESAVAACQSQIRETDFELEIVVASNLPPVRGDSAALRRALQNLISNAIKYDGKNRWARITAHRSPGTKGEPGNEVEISIEDRGLGIRSADLPHIFEPFYRGDEAVSAQIEGSGVGLSLVKQIVEAHGGKVSVKSSQGTGSTFTIQLPIAYQAATQQHQPGHDNNS